MKLQTYTKQEKAWALKTIKKFGGRFPFEKLKEHKIKEKYEDLFGKKKTNSAIYYFFRDITQHIFGQPQRISYNLNSVKDIHRTREALNYHLYKGKFTSIEKDYIKSFTGTHLKNTSIDERKKLIELLKKAKKRPAKITFHDKRFFKIKDLV